MFYHLAEETFDPGLDALDAAVKLPDPGKGLMSVPLTPAELSPERGLKNSPVTSTGCHSTFQKPRAVWLIVK